MQQKHKTYLALIGVLTVSVLIALYLPVNDVFKGIASTPAICALIAALWQILRDQSAFEKNLLLQQKEHIFGLGVTSHMANTVFDRHISFCDDYMAEVQSTIATLISTGASEKAGEHAGNFFRIRQKYSAWITNDMSRSLETFEAALQNLACRAREVTRAADGSPQLAQALQKADATWDKLLGGLFNRKTEVDKDIAVKSIEDKLRDMLGIEKLMRIRQWIVDRAARCIDGQ
jgi:hypothetical protein